MFDEINTQLLRIKACGIGLSAIEKPGSPKQSFVKVSLGSRSCTISARGFLEMLKSLPDGATEASVQAALEMSSQNAESWSTA